LAEFKLGAAKKGGGGYFTALGFYSIHSHSQRYLSISTGFHFFFLKVWLEFDQFKNVSLRYETTLIFEHIIF